MTQEERDNFRQWISGIPYEVSFWKSYYHHPESLRQLYSWSDYDNECSLDEFDIQSYVERCGDRPLLADVGCALSYVLGSRFAKEGVTLEYVDPLAHFYNKILDDAKIDRKRIKFGMLETLSTTYAPGTVDLVHVRNALDHSANPMTGIYESLICLKPGGVLYLHHHRNEAQRENYRGFHQYNIDAEQGRLIIWNKDRRLDVNALLEGVADIKTTITERDYVVSVITKKAEVPETLYDSRAAIARNAEMLALYMEYFNSRKNALSYVWKSVTAAIAHPAMRRVPRSLVEGLKKLLS